MKIEISSVYRLHSRKKNSFNIKKELIHGINHIEQISTYEKGSFLISPTNPDEIIALEEVIFENRDFYFNEFKNAKLDKYEKLTIKNWKVLDGPITMDLLNQGYYKLRTHLKDEMKSKSITEYLINDCGYQEEFKDAWIDGGCNIEKLPNWRI